MCICDLYYRLGKCEVCNNQEAKYTCPRCEVKTCCLTCVNIHKNELGCNGQRNRVAYKRISEFTNLDLLSGMRPSISEYSLVHTFITRIKLTQLYKCI
jgi:hypothetical protein